MPQPQLEETNDNNNDNRSLNKEQRNSPTQPTIPPALPAWDFESAAVQKMNDFAAGSSRKSTNSRLPPEVNRILYVRNLYVFYKYLSNEQPWNFVLNNRTL